MILINGDDRPPLLPFGRRRLIVVDPQATVLPPNHSFSNRHSDRPVAATRGQDHRHDDVVEQLLTVTTTVGPAAHTWRPWKAIEDATWNILGAINL
jgi:hypothetical protein